MKLHYYRETASLYIEFRGGPGVEARALLGQRLSNRSRTDPRPTVSNWFRVRLAENFASPVSRDAPPNSMLPFAISSRVRSRSLRFSSSSTSAFHLSSQLIRKTPSGPSLSVLRGLRGLRVETLPGVCFPDL